MAKQYLLQNVSQAEIESVLISLKFILEEILHIEDVDSILEET